MKMPIHVMLAGLLLLSGCAMQSQPVDLEKEKASILAVIASETESYFQEDFDAWRSTYVDEPYFRLYGYWDGFDQKVLSYNGFDALEAVKKKQFEESKTIWKGSREERKNVNVRIFPEVAWLTFEQEAYENGTDSLLGRSLETRILEKHDGDWKIAYLGYHYLPSQEE